MTELYIDGTLVILPENFSTTVKQENTLFTKKGEYTYEIALHLDNPVNAECYSHLNRMNNTSELKTKRTAILISDNRVYCKGTEIVTGWDLEKVNIQLVSGGSELNYFISNNLLLEDLDMGKADLSNPFQYVKYYYPTVNFCLCPIGNKSSNNILNEWRPALDWEVAPGIGIIPVIREDLYGDLAVFYAQPYLCFYVEILMQALGYKVEKNDLVGSEWQTLYLPQSGHPTEYAKMFPKRTVSEFMEEVENLFNLSFVIDIKKHTVRILFNNIYFIAQKEVTVQNVVDMYSIEISDEDESHSRCNIVYDIPDNEFYRFYKLNEDILNSSTLMKLETEKSIDEYLYGKNYAEVKNILFLESEQGRYYIADNTTQPEWQRKVEVNQFGDIKREGIENEIKIGMVPAEMAAFSLKSPMAGSSGGYYDIDEMTKVHFPCMENDPVQNDANKGIFDKLSDTDDTDKTSSAPFQVAFYQGMDEVALWVNIVNDPNHGMEEANNPMYTRYPKPFILKEKNKLFDGGNLRLTYMDKMLYSGSYDIDISKPYSVESYDPNVYDARLIFNIRNKRYVCKTIESILDRNGRKGPWKGTFYPIKLNDIEAQKRWILDDGKWRDGGVWIENGRWLDE